MPRTTKKAAVIDPNMVTISDFCQTQGINEQIFRLELMQHSDSADSDKIVSFDVAQQVADSLAASTKQLPQTQEIAETVTPQAIQPSPEPAQNPGDSPQENISENSKLAQTQSQQALGTSTKSGNTKGTVPTALDELISSAEDDINLVDLVMVYRNQQIAANTQTRDNELVAQLRERRIERRNQVFDHIRALNSRQPAAPELPELPAALSDEIAALSDELGKRLSIG